MKHVEIHLSLNFLARIAVPRDPPPEVTVHRWLKALGAGKNVNGRIVVCGEDLAVLSAYGWLRRGTPLKIQTATALGRKALVLLKRRKRPVVIVLQLARKGIKAEVKTRHVKRENQKGIYVYPLSSMCDHMIKAVEDALRRGDPKPLLLASVS